MCIDRRNPQVITNGKGKRKLQPLVGIRNQCGKPISSCRCPFTVAVVNIVIMLTDVGVNTESETGSFFTSNEKTRGHRRLEINTAIV